IFINKPGGPAPWSRRPPPGKGFFWGPRFFFAPAAARGLAAPRLSLGGERRKFYRLVGSSGIMHGPDTMCRYQWQREEGKKRKAEAEAEAEEENQVLPIRLTCSDWQKSDREIDL
ncbi:MAG: hypothetical protein RMI90_11580, partial [Thermoguttaceae bacterium]|nr:hypothetical protein [Thermoguttaceae bacterium]